MAPPEIAGLRYVNKQLNVLGRNVYNLRIAQNKEIIQALWEGITNNASLEQSNKPRSVLAKQIMEFVHQVYNIDWTIFVHDIDFMSKIFKLCAQLHPYRQTFNFWRDNYIDQRQYDSIYNKIRGYLYLEAPKTYTVSELRKYAVFKKVPRAGRRTRSELMACLRRPSNEIYLHH
jgi:hypothetical protein